MATKSELIGGLELLIGEGKRIAARFGDDEWKLPGDEGGWTTREVFSHVAGIGGVVVPFAMGIANAGPETDIGANLDINATNAQIVGERKDKPVAEVAEELARNYSGVIDWVKQTPDEFLEKRGTFGGYKNMTLGDLLMQAIVMHGISHLYHAGASVFA